MIRYDEGLAFLLKYENVAWYEDGKVKILDRRVYPMDKKYLVCKNHIEVAQAIKDMVTQSGGPYLAAEMGMVQAANESKNMDELKMYEYLEKAAFNLSHARPTTSKKMEECTNSILKAIKNAKESGKDIVEEAFNKALINVNEKYKKYKKIGENLAQKFPKNGTIMTQCFGETIIGMFLLASKNSNNNIKVICPETRPYLQGARLTASCVCDMGFDVTVITDNMPAYVMKNKNVDVFTSAADVITMDGNIINKIGTFQIALCANYYEIPYYVTGIPNINHKTLENIIIEERNPNQVIEILDKKFVLDGVKGYYPAFDITPPKYCNGVVTDKGILSPYDLDDYFKR